MPHSATARSIPPLFERYRGIHTRAFRHETAQRVSAAHTRLRYGEHTPQKDSTALWYHKDTDLSHGSPHLRIADDAFRRRVHRKRIENARTQPNKDHTGVCRDSPERVFRDVEKILPLIAQYRFNKLKVQEQ